MVDKYPFLNKNLLLFSEEKQVSDNNVVASSWTELISRITYKKHYRLEYFPDIHYKDEGRLLVFVETEDTYNLDNEIIIQHSFPLPSYDYVPEGYKKELIRNLLHEVEIHEADEWLRFDGVMVFDPHKKRT